MNQMYKAKELAGKLNYWVNQTSEGVWAIPSSNGGTYKVIVNDDEVSCECKGFEYSENCYHVMAVKIKIEEHKH